MSLISIIIKILIEINVIMNEDNTDQKNWTTSSENDHTIHKKSFIKVYPGH